MEIQTFLDGDLRVTTDFVEHIDTVTRRSSFIPVAAITFVGKVETSRPIFGAIGALFLIGALVVGSYEPTLAGLAVIGALIFFVLYMRSQRRALRIASSGGSIDLDVRKDEGEPIGRAVKTMVLEHTRRV